MGPGNMSKKKSKAAAEASSVPSSLQNEPVDELQRLAMTAQDALTDSIVERLATSTANVLEIADRLNDEETRDALHAVLDNLTELHRIGALDTLFQMVKLMHAARDATTDNIVERLFAFVENMLSNVATDEMAELLGNVTGAMDDALEASR